MHSTPVSVAVVGLGPVGAEIVRVIASRKWARLVAAVDRDPAKAGRDVAEIVRLPEPLGVRVTPELEESVDVVCHATSSSLADSEAQIVALLGRGAEVISTCEELAFPLDAEVASRIATAAEAADRTVLGTGINPGFIMDKLPLTMSAVCQEITAIEIHRVVNASLRREPLQRKIGVGMTSEEFRSAMQEGKIRHVGLRQSLAMIAHGLGVELDWWGEEIIQPVLAATMVYTDTTEVKAGRVAGIHQQISGGRRGQIEVLLDLRMFVGAEHAGDRIEIRGVPDISLTLAGGIHGDRATAALVVNAIPRILQARAGLITMDDLPISHR